ncbi:MAG: PAS domain-containing protein [bacterium]
MFSSGEKKPPEKGKEDVLTEELKMFQGYIKALWDFLPLPICDINTAFIIINTDKKFNEFFEFKPDEAAGMNLEKLIKGKQSFENLKNKILENETISNMEITVVTKTGKEKPISIFSQTREYEEKIPISYFLAFVDMSQIKEASVVLEEKVRELENFQKVAVGRELKMIELKDKLAELETKVK